MGISIYRDAEGKRHCIESRAGRSNKDNSCWGQNAKGGPSGNVIRWPSVKRSDRVWRNFYRLFPRLYFQVRYAAAEAGVQPGSITSLVVAGSTTKLDGSVFPNVDRTIKVKVLDMTGEFTEIVGTNEYLYYRKKSPILDSNKRKLITKEII